MKHPISRTLTDHNDSYADTIAKLEEDMALLVDNGWNDIGPIQKPYVDAMAALNLVREVNARAADIMQDNLDALEDAARLSMERDLRGLL